MGGTYGHIKHLYEDFDLKYRDVIDIYQKIRSSELVCREKIDGMQLSFSQNKKHDCFFARSQTDMKIGGLNRAQLLTKFEKYPLARKAIDEAVDAICRLSAPPDIWHSIEIVYPENLNVILYDTNAIVSHDEALDKCLPSTTVSGWRFVRSSDLSIKLHPHSFDLFSANGKLSIRDFINVKVESMRVYFKDFDEKMKSDFIEHFLVGKPTLAYLRKRYKRGFESSVDKFVSDSINTCVEGVGAVHLHNASYLFKDVSSVLISDQSRNIAQIKHRLETALSSPEVEKNDKVLKHVRRLKMVPKDLRGLVTIEGVVFTYNNTQYKITGQFAPINQILGVGRYNR